MHAADPEVTETIRFTNRPYCVLQGNIRVLQATKDHVNVFLYDGAMVPDPEKIITGGHDNKTGRTVAIRQGEPINASALTAMFKQIIANNRAGGWRKLKRKGGSTISLSDPDRASASLARGEGALCALQLGGAPPIRDTLKINRTHRRK